MTLKYLELTTCINRQARRDSTKVDDIMLDDETDEGFEDSSIALAISEDMETIGMGETPAQDDELGTYEGEEGEDEEDADNEEPEQVCIHIMYVVCYIVAMLEW